MVAGGEAVVINHQSSRTPNRESTKPPDVLSTLKAPPTSANLNIPGGSDYCKLQAHGLRAVLVKLRSHPSLLKWPPLGLGTIP
jgi:hypothetical protein